MRLDPLCDLDLSYRETPMLGGQFLLVRPYTTQEGTGYGEGDGIVSGPRLNGSVRWVNHPHRRSDGIMLPDAHGVIQTDDRSTLLFSLRGHTTFEGPQGQQMLVMCFETESERYQWLNSALCVVEGAIEMKSGVMRARVFVCVYEFQ
jgi:hypothetical protein